MINPNGNNCPFALQNIVCILLLEVTTFLRETYQYLPKKLNSANISVNPRYENIHRDPNVAQRGTRDNRNNVGSVFSNESSNISIGGAGGGETLGDLNEVFAKEKPSIVKFPSNDNINSEVDHHKHISFAFMPEKDDECSLGSNTNINHLSPGGEFGEEKSLEMNRLSTGGVSARNSTISFHDKLQNNFLNKRNSLKSPRRTSLKYRTDRSKSSNNTSNSNLRRKLSQGTNASIQLPDDKEAENIIYLNNNANVGEISDTAFQSSNQPSPDPATNASSTTQNVSSTSPPTSNVLNSNSSYNESAYNAANGEFCEVDEVDFNRCFPWIKVRNV